MSNYKHFAVIGAGNMGCFIINELVKAKAAGSVSSVVVITRSVSIH
jgi:pyrroline-5-carboxylate reductase